tara:strand:+ start:19132 stop:20814 length:1683 start_codon:yes stop_codon:yes gene_type:complete
LKKLDINTDLDSKKFSELTELLNNIISNENPIEISKDIELIKSVFYKKFNFKKSSKNISENDLKKEMMFKKALLLYKKNRNTLREEINNQEKRNLKEKENIINEINQLTEQKELLNSTFSKFRSLQKKWSEIGFVPIKFKTDIWQSYNHNVVKFYDYIKLNKELRDIDFSKNLKLKEQICIDAKKLVNETSINKMDMSLQDLHIKWKKIGPVKKEYREEIWKKFQKISKDLNKKKNDFFIKRKKIDNEKAKEKNEISKKIKSLIDKSNLTISDWKSKTLECEELTNKWKKIGKLEKNNNKKAWKEFKNSLDYFYKKKRNFYETKKLKDVALINRKKEICQEAKKLKLSTEWKKSSDKLIKLQKEWKLIAYTKQSKHLWQDFKNSTDYFFKKRNETFKNAKHEERKIVEEKKKILIKIKNLKLKPTTKKENLNILKNYISNWYDDKNIIPNKNLNSKFDNLIIAKYLEIGIDYRTADIYIYKIKIKSIKDKTKLITEEKNLLNSSLDIMEKKLLQYQNNIDFLSNNTQTESLYKKVEDKINTVKQDVDHINHKQKILNDIK